MQKLQRESFSYFLHETNPANGLVIDKTHPTGPPVLPPPDSPWRLPAGSRNADSCPRGRGETNAGHTPFLWNSPQGPEPDATGYRAFTTIFSICGRPTRLAM